MNLMEILLVTIGISLDVFAAVTCEGAQLAKIHKGKALQACGAAALLQSAALFLGHLGAALLNHFDKQDNLSLTARMAAAIIFLIMGARQLLKAWRRDTVVEHREEVHAVFGKSLHLFQFAAVYTMLAGAGLGLTIARDIVRLHGGDLRAGSRDGLTVFTVELPVPQS